VSHRFLTSIRKGILPIFLILAVSALILAISLPAFHQHVPTDTSRCVFHLIEKNVVALEIAAGFSSPFIQPFATVHLDDWPTPEQNHPFSRIPRAPPVSSF